MKHIHVRCPSCSKLYEVETQTIYSSQPQFQCLSCQTNFTFSYPPANFNMEVTAQKVPTETQMIFRVCMKCGAQTAKHHSSCQECQSLFDPIKQNELGPGLKVQPSLVLLWKRILDDYNREAHHMEFIRTCRKFQALNFAKMKYEEIGKLQGGDLISKKMISRIEAIEDSDRLLNSANKLSKDNLDVSNLFKILIYSPLLIAAVMVFWGFSQGGNRNMVGAGIAIGLLTLGGIYGFFGGVNFKKIRLRS